MKLCAKVENFCGGLYSMYISSFFLFEPPYKSEISLLTIDFFSFNVDFRKYVLHNERFNPLSVGGG